MKFTHLSGWLASILISFPLLGQDIPGLQQSNYGGLYRASYNPAALGGSPQKFQINILSLGGSITRRYFDFIGKNSLLTPLLVPHSTKEIYGRSRTMGSITSGDQLFLASDIRWPSVLLALDRYQSIAVQFRSRGFIQGSQVPADIQNLYKRRLDTGLAPASSGSWGPMGLAQLSFSEIDFSYGVQVLDLDAHKLRLGATVKRIIGARTSYVRGSIDQYEVREQAAASEISTLILKDINYESGYSQASKGLRIGDLFDKQQYGAGWAMDLGVTYELGNYWINEKESFDDSPTYLIRLSASVTDLGSVRYKTANSSVVRGNLSEKSIGQSEMETISDRGAEGFMELFPSDDTTPFQGSMQLPQALHLEADVQLVQGFFLNMSKTSRFKPADDELLDVYLPNSFTIGPRWENEDSNVAFPVTFIEGNKKVSIGAVAHFGPIFVGVNNMGTLFKKSPNSAGMAYIGLSVWKMKRRMKSRQDK
ncbi:DUF5723 family protein [Dyadobacter tibetensis]|uniref:DUF5723 family protein n=1 Tax=Dyadobacter tibetensis TaxID=1211851 RepID=UPI00046F22B9|nr:DUF5723 family protein [Dyadobacter tibetensis]